MVRSANQIYLSPLKLFFWFCIFLSGIVVIILGLFIVTPINKMDIIGKVIYGVGISFITVSFFKTIVIFMDGVVNRKMYKNHIEIFAEKRNKSIDKYNKENEKITSSLQIMSFSSNHALTELQKNNRLFKALTKKDAEIKLLIINPSSGAAQKQAKIDYGFYKGMDIMYKKFERIKDICLNLEKDLNENGSIEIRIMEDNPHLTIYSRDEETLIYGHYFSDLPGEEYAAMKIRSSWNKKVFDQYKDYFESNWKQVQAMKNKEEYLLVKKKRGDKSVYFNDDLYDKIIKECNIIMSKSKQSES